MKKLLLLLVITAMVGTTAVAQEQKAGKQDRSEWEKKMKDELKLTADQTEKYDALNKEYNDKIDALMSDVNTTDKSVQKEKKMALKKEKETKLMEILTPEQQTKYKELVEKKKKEMTSKSGS